MDPFVYLDNNATTMPSPAVREAMLPFLGAEYGNPSSLHAPGGRAAKALGRAREQVAALLGARPAEVVFTSCGSESDAAAILGALEAAGERRHVVTTTVEHPAVRTLLRWLRGKGRIELTEVGVARDGTLDAAAVLAAVRPDTALVSVMWANNESGVVHPVEALAEGCRAKGVPFHVDAVQAAGKVPVDLGKVPADLLAVSAHKFHGPKGVGALVVRRGARWKPVLVGGHQEKERRAGTENVPGIVGTGVAAAEALAALPGEERVGALRDRMEAAVLAGVPGAQRNGASRPRVPNTTNLAFPGVEGEAVLLQLDRRGIAVSSGSACTAGSLDPSHVLTAMGVPERLARSSIRVSLSRFTTGEEADRAAAAIVEVVAALRALAPAHGERR